MPKREVVQSRFELFSGPGRHLDELEPLIADERVELRSPDALLDDPAGCADPAVLLVDAALVDAIELDRVPIHVVVVATDRVAEDALGEGAELSLAPIVDTRGRQVLLRAAFKLSAERLTCGGIRADLERTLGEVTELNRIGLALMTEHDRDTLVGQILAQAMRITVSDVGALFLIEDAEDGSRQIRFKLRMVGSLRVPVSHEDYVLAIDTTSAVGYATMTGKPLLHDDIHDLPPDTPYEVHWIATDAQDYWIKSMCTIPMIGSRGQVVGVLTLGNRMTDPNAQIVDEADADRWVIPYSERDVEFGMSFAGMAAISIENTNLVQQIEDLFESLVKASVIAIDQRDPTTAGHSIRVAMLTTDLAEAVERAGRGAYRDTRFTPDQMRELRYAAMLHDFGKIGVREDVLVKAHKMPTLMCERVEARFDLIQYALAREYERNRAQLLLDGADAKDLDEIEEQYREQSSEVDRCRTIVRSCNKPTLLATDVSEQLLNIAKHTFDRMDGPPEPYLTEDELHFLQVPNGSLDEEERREVQSHAQLTLEYLSHISWLDGTKNVPRYAAAHHEKLDGSGYPLHLKAEHIPVQTRMITIADIFDALTASDRPYKRAVPPDAALDIITSEAKAGLLDPDLVQIMVDGRVYRRVLEEDWRTY